MEDAARPTPPAKAEHFITVIMVGRRQYRETLDYCREQGLWWTGRRWYRFGRSEAEIQIYGSPEQLMAFAGWSNPRFGRLKLGREDIQRVGNRGGAELN